MRRTAMVSLTTSWPNTSAWPESGGRRVTSILIVVVLPAPLGPSRPKISPEVMSKLTPSTARTSLKRRVIMFARTAGAGAEAGAWSDTGFHLHLPGEVDQHLDAFDERPPLPGGEAACRQRDWAPGEHPVAGQQSSAFAGQIDHHLAAVGHVDGAGQVTMLLELPQLTGQSRGGYAEAGG